MFSGKEDLAFHEATLTQDDITDAQGAIQKRILAYFHLDAFPPGEKHQDSSNFLFLYYSSVTAGTDDE